MSSAYLGPIERIPRRIVATLARVKDGYFDRFEHPLLFLLVPIAGVLLASSYAAQLNDSQMFEAFLALYAMSALIICLMGYIAFYTLKFSTQTLRWWRYRRYRSD